MKKIIALLFLLNLSTSVIHAQDQIITKKYDTINAKITKIKKGLLHFDFVKNGKVTSTLLPLYDVEDFQKAYYATSEVDNAPKNKKIENNEESFLFSARAGYGYRIAKVENDNPAIRKYLKELKNGFAFETGGHYLISESFGVGLHYNGFFTKNDLQLRFADGDTQATIEDKINIHFIGPSVITRLLTRNLRNSLNLSTAIGYISYQNTEINSGQTLDFKGNTLGVSMNFHYDVGLSDHIMISFGASYIGGVLTKLEVTENNMTRTIDLEEETGATEGLGRIDLTVGMSILL